jgi:AcrR family transcriptional regulator
VRHTLKSTNAVSSEKRTYELKVRAERQQETRRRIVAATAALHEEVGPARTTVAEIARRAGVQRLTVYTHFPDERELFGACQALTLGAYPPPDFADALASADPRGRVEQALGLLYAWYRSAAPMTSKVLRDRAQVPALDALLIETLDAQMAGLAQALAAGFGPPTPRRSALLHLAVDFTTWERLTTSGLTDDEAAALIADAAERG